MKVILVVTTIALIISCLAWTTQTAPFNFKNGLYKSIISQVLAQQGSSSTEDKNKEMAATYCKLLLQTISSFATNFVEGSIDDYCKVIELPPEPKPEERSSTLDKTYQGIFNVLKKMGLNGDNIIG